MEIALNEVLRRMKIADVRLTTILEHLAKHNYHKPQLGTDLGKDAWALLVAALEEWTRPTAVVPPWRQQLGSSLFGVAYGDCDVSVVTVLGS